MNVLFRGESHFRAFAVSDRGSPGSLIPSIVPYERESLDRATDALGRTRDRGFPVAASGKLSFPSIIQRDGILMKLSGEMNGGWAIISITLFFLLSNRAVC